MSRRTGRGSGSSRSPRRSKRHKAAPDELDIAQPVELVVLALRDRTARCRILGSEREITLRCGDVLDLVPAEIVSVEAHKQWRYGGHPYLSGEIVGHRLDVGVLGLQPLRLLGEWPWDPAEEYWGEEDEPLEDWAKAIVARGPRVSFEMEQVIPGEDPEDWDDDPILRASDLHAAGEYVEARKALMDVLAEDLRCLDAHAHLGNFAFDHRVDDALRHYEAGVRIGELSLGEDFDGVLPWIRVDNRPFLRCMHGYGLCLWRLGRPAEAAAVFERMLWLSPMDNQGVRALLPGARAGGPWYERLESLW